MGKTDIIKILRRFREILETKGVRVDRLVLFGSWANGRAQEFSDIDVVVISKNFEGKDFWARTNILTEAIYPILEPIQAIALTPKEWETKDSTICELAQDGEVLAV